MKHDLINVFREYIQTHRLLNSDDKVLVAVSGGPDSMALLHLFARLEEVDFGVFHLNHQLRDEAVEEGEYVADVSKKYGICCHTYNYDVPQYLKDTGESLETGARTIRYQLINQCMEEHGYTKTALGHHRDDQAETVLLNLLRGTGLPGLAGMQPQRNSYIRPLLAVSREQILNYCSAFNIKYYHDESNFSTEFRRNKIRLELIPLIENEYNPQFSKHLVQLAEIISADEAELTSLTEQLLDELTFRKNGIIYLKRDLFNQLSIALQRRLLQTCTALAKNSHEWVPYEHIETLRHYIIDKHQFCYEILPLTIIGTTNNILFGEPEFSHWESGVLPVPGEVVVGNYRIKTAVLSLDQISLPGKSSEDFDLEELTLPLIYRKRQAGDRMQVFGQHSQKKVKDILIDAKIPRYLRDQIPLICDQDEIILISQVRRSEKGRISADTKRILRITVEIIAGM